MPEGRYIAYYRVSAAKRGRSGLGLEAQQAAVLATSTVAPGRSWTRSPRWRAASRADRPKLARALTACRLTGATLMIAKLDRLTRNAAFLANLIGERCRARSLRQPSFKPVHDPYLGRGSRAEREGPFQVRKGGTVSLPRHGESRLGGYRG
jgi:DNA invertase Pin-like site-specific DNA recombinase